jgi:putative ABC transport system permease protein
MNRVALRMLMGDRAKYLGILVGITFASLLITQQSAIYDGLLERSYGAIVDQGLTDIWVMDPKVQQIDDYKYMQNTLLYRVRGVEGVAWAMPMYRGQIKARLEDGTQQSCTVIGIDDTTLIGGPPVMVEGSLADLRRADGVIIDEREARDKLGKLQPDGTKRPLKIGDTLEINDHRTVVVGLCKTMRTFMWFPTVFTTYSRALTIAPGERRQLAYVLVKAQAGTDRQALCEKITAVTGMAALTSEGFKQKTLDFIMRETGIPINFKISMLLGFLVGAVIAGQTFYNFTLDNLRHFGALKAMGASNGLLMRMVLMQALLVGAIGYGLGVGLASLFGLLFANTELAFRLMGDRLLYSAGAVMVICSFSAVISMRKVIKLEPAVVFRS